jgi:hypothetical protein
MRELAEDQVSPAYSGECEFYRRRGRSSFQKRWNHRGYRFVHSGACLWAGDIILKYPGQPTQRYELRRDSNRRAGVPGPKSNSPGFRLDVEKGSGTLAPLLEELKHLSFTLTSADSGPTGTLGSHRFALVFDSPHGADLSQIQNVLRPIGALLIGAYRPVDITP